MSGHPDWQPELRNLLDRLHDGEFLESDRRRLNDLLQAGPDRREYFITYMDVHSLLTWEGGRGTRDVEQGQDTSANDECNRMKEELRPSDSSIRPSSSIRHPSEPLPLIVVDPPSFSLPHSHVFSLGGAVFSYMISTMILGVAMLWAWAYVISPDYPAVRGSAPMVAKNNVGSPEMKFIGRITGMVDCQWSDPKTEAFNGAYVSLGRKYALASGLMEITYDAGAKVILQGPCTYEVDSADGGYLSGGRLTARVEKRGDGRGKREENLANRQFVNGNPRHHSPLFSVRTPTAIVTDLGTEFGVEYDKSGVTWSFVFLGSVRLQAASADGKTRGLARVLHEKESARVEKNGVSRGGGDSVILLGSTAKSGDFVRKMPKQTIRVFDLVDVVAGGDGHSGLRNRGINPTNGQADDKTPADALGQEWYVGDRKYHRVAALPFVDGVFIPDGRIGPVQISSAGHVFAEFPKTDNKTPSYIWAGGKVRTALQYNPALLGGVDYSAPGRGVLFFHANQAITFDLEAIRHANPGQKVMRFLATAGNTEYRSSQGDSVCADLWVIVDGHARFQRQKISSRDGAFPISIRLGGNDRFLTLAGTDGGNGITCDWIAFGDPRLELVGIEKPKESGLP